MHHRIHILIVAVNVVMLSQAGIIPLREASTPPGNPNSQISISNVPQPHSDILSDTQSQLASLFDLIQSSIPSTEPKQSHSKLRTKTPRNIHNAHHKRSPPQKSPDPPLSPSQICTNITSNPTHENYTQPYSCTMKHDYAILGLYYDSCTIMNFNSNNSDNPLAPAKANKTLLYAPPESTSTSSPTPSDSQSTAPLEREQQPNAFFCCDPSSSSTSPDLISSSPSTVTAFDALCIWGNGTDMAAWSAAGHPAGTLPTTSDAQIRQAKCFVGPIIHPKAKCVQVQNVDFDWL